MQESSAVPFANLDAAALARALSQIAERSDDLVDLYLERREEVGLPPEDEAPGLRLWREQGLAVRLVREGTTWLASRDAIEARQFTEALRQVARAMPTAAYPEPRLELPPWPAPAAAEEVLEFPSVLQRALRQRHVAFPLRLAVSRHRRWLQVVRAQLVPAPEQESFYSATVDLPWGRYGTLLADCSLASAERLASALTGLFRARQAATPETCRGVVVLGPAAAADAAMDRFKKFDKLKFLHSQLYQTRPVCRDNPHWRDIDKN